MLSSEVFGNTGGCQPLQHLGRTVGEDVRKGSELVAGRNLFKSREPTRGFLGFESSAGMPIRGPGLGREPRSSISQCSLNKVRFKPPFSYGASARLLHSVLGSVDHESLFFDPLSTPFPFPSACELRELSRRSAEGAVFVHPQLEAEWCHAKARNHASHARLAHRWQAEGRRQG